MSFLPFWTKLTMPSSPLARKVSGGKEALQAEMKRRSKASNGGQLFSGSVEYYRRASILEEAALRLIKKDVADRVSNRTQQIAAALNISKVPSKQTNWKRR